MDIMMAPSIDNFILSADSQQGWFTDPAKSPERGWRLDWLPIPLTEGILNRYETSTGNITCMNPDWVFGSKIPGEYHADPTANNLWSCAFYPNFTRDYRESRMTPENRTFVSSLDIDTSLETSRNVTGFISTCLVAYCENSAVCNSPSCSAEHLILNDTLLSAAEMDTCLASICAHNPKKLTNQDIAGIGAMTAYTIQFVVATISIFITTISFAFEKSTDRWIRRSREIFLIFLDEFQRTQCCFVIAVAIATLGVLSGLSTEDKDSVITASSTSITPTLIVLALLMHANGLEYSRFTFWLTFCAWIFSSAVRLDPRTNIYDPSRFAQPLKEYADACGSISSSSFCGYTPQWWAMRYLSFICSIPCMMYLIKTHFKPSTKRSWPLMRRALCRVFGNKANTPRLSFLLSLVVVAGKVSIFIFDVACLVAAIGSCAWSAIILTTAWRTLMTREWSFGQILAVSVWLPNLFSLINDCIYGPLTGRTNQLPPPLKVIRSERPQTTSLPTQSLDATAQNTVITTSTLSTRSSVRHHGHRSIHVTPPISYVEYYNYIRKA